MRFTIKEPVYQTEIHVFAGEPFSKVKRWVKKNLGEHFEDDDPSGTTDARFIGIEDRRIYALWFKQTSYSDIEIVGLIAHESIHICSTVFSNVGMMLSAFNEEAFAYLHQFYVDELCKRLYSTK